jgi:DNA-binding response OmpR family regulator
VQPPLAIPKSYREPMGRDGSSRSKGRARPTAADTMLEFGPFRVLPRQRRLLADGVPVELGTRVRYPDGLAQGDGALVTKNELLSRVWPFGMPGNGADLRGG